MSDHIEVSVRRHSPGDVYPTVRVAELGLNPSQYAHAYIGLGVLVEVAGNEEVVRVSGRTNKRGDRLYLSEGWDPEFMGSAGRARAFTVKVDPGSIIIS
jgi:hypothetical protein